MQETPQRCFSRHHGRFMMALLFAWGTLTGMVQEQELSVWHLKCSPRRTIVFSRGNCFQGSPVPQSNAPKACSVIIDSVFYLQTLLSNTTLFQCCFHFKWLNLCKQMEMNHCLSTLSVPCVFVCNSRFLKEDNGHISMLSFFFFFSNLTQIDGFWNKMQTLKSLAHGATAWKKIKENMESL